MSTTQEDRSAELAQQYADGLLPPRPTIESVVWEPPATSDPVVFTAPDRRLLLHANSDNSGKAAMVPDYPGATDKSTMATLRNYWGNRDPAQYTLTLQEYWRLVPATYTQVMQGGGYTESYSVTEGVSATTSQSLSAQLGVDEAGISASITATFDHSVTTSTERSYSRSYSVGSPPEGKIRVWMLWQLMHDMAALDSNGRVIAGDQGEGDVYWWGPGDSVSGAYLSYSPVKVSIPSTFYVPSQADFPALFTETYS
jgi:hypothetical protein